MADATAEIYDPNTGRLLASAGLLGFVCRKSGTGKSVARIGGNTTPSTILVDVSGFSRPVVAITTFGFGSAFVSRNGNQVNFACGGGVGSDYTFYVFDWTEALPAHVAEAQLFTSDGRCTFSNKFWPMKVMRALPGGSGLQFDAPSGRLLAAAGTTFGGHNHASNFYCNNGISTPDDPVPANCTDVKGRNDGKVYGGAIINGGSSMVASQITFDDVTSSFGSYAEWQKYDGGWDAANQVLAIDVTNIPIGQTFF